MPAQPATQYSATETYSKNILGPAFFRMSDLAIAGSAGEPLPPEFVAPSQSPYIVADDETFTVSLKVEFNRSPLTSLLMCLGTDVKVTFAFEGIGGQAAEEDLEVTITTEKDKYVYSIEWEGTPEMARLTPGLYGVAAIAQVGPVRHECSQPILGYGYLAGVLLQVYSV